MAPPYPTALPPQPMRSRTRTLLDQLTQYAQERRHHARHELDVETVCRALADDADMPARIRNVSRSGISLTVPRSVPVGTMARVSLPVPTDTPPTTVLACVNNVREVGEDEWYVGCVFSLELSSAEMRAFGGQKQAAGPADQRAWVRFPAKGTVEYRVLPGDGTGPKIGDLVDISPGGVGMALEAALEAGTALSVTLKRKDGKPDRPMLACVVYLTQREDGKWAAGCQFLRELSEDELNELVWQGCSA